MIRSAVRLLPLLILLLASALLAGCAYDVVTREEQLMMNGRFHDVVQIVEPRVAASPSPSTQDLVVLCMAYSRLKNYGKLFTCVDRLQANIEAGRKTIYISDVSYYPNDMRAEANIELGHYDKAIAEAQILYQHSDLGLMGRGVRIRALSYKGLAEALSGKMPQAEQTLAELEGIGTYYPFVLLATPKNVGLARIYMALGRYDRAAATMEQASSEGLWQGLADVVAGAAMRGESMFAWDELPRQFVLYKAYLETGRVAEARTGFDTLLANPRATDNGYVYWLLLYDRARVAEHDGDRAGAIDFLKRATAVIERQRATIASEASKIGFVGDKQAVYGMLVAALVRASHNDDAFDYAERAKARALVDMLAGRADLSARRQDPIVVKNLLDELARRERDSLVIAADVDADRITRSVEAAKTAIRDVAPELASLVTVTTLPSTQVRTRLRNDDALVEYFWQSEGRGKMPTLSAFVLTRDTITAHILDAHGLTADVQRFRQAINLREGEAWRPEAKALYGRLIAPLAARVHGKRHLTIVPHGALHYLPFNALLADDGHFLIEQHTLRLLPSASVMPFLDKSLAPSQGLLVFGNPDLGNPRYNLPGAEAESRAIARLWPDSRVILRRNASETLMKKTAGAFKYLHLASHGQFNPDDPLKSRMLLAPDKDNDGNLTVPEIYDLSLNADMVVLSACQTALGDIENGDDVVGLNRGFLYAGARAIVGSLWEVPDNPTKDLMVDLYTNLKTMELPDAMQRAQVAALKKYMHPIAWAAFQVTGGP